MADENDTSPEFEIEPSAATLRKRPAPPRAEPEHTDRAPDPPREKRPKRPATVMPELEDAAPQDAAPLELDWDRGPATLRNRSSGPAAPADSEREPPSGAAPNASIAADLELDRPRAPRLASPVPAASVPIVQGKPVSGPAAPASAQKNLLAQARTKGVSGAQPWVQPRPSRVETEPLATSIARAFAVPLMGKGALWLPLLFVVLIGGAVLPGRFGLILDFAFLGMLANYFAKALAVGLDGEFRSPDPPKINNFTSEFVLPGLAFLGLIVALFALPTWQAMRMSDEAEKSANDKLAAIAATRDAARADVRTEALNPDEVFMDQNGKLLHPKASDPPMIAKRSDGRWVRIEPEWGTINYIPGNDPANAAQLDAADAARVNGADADAGPLSGASKGQILLFVILFLLPFFYVPMALAVASSSDSIAQMFNPAHVGGAAARSGFAYFAVVIVGFAAMFVPTVIAVKVLAGGGFLLSRAIFLSGLAYTFAVQGYLMGCLARGRPEMLPELSNR